MALAHLGIARSSFDFHRRCVIPYSVPLGVNLSSGEREMLGSLTRIVKLVLSQQSVLLALLGAGSLGFLVAVFVFTGSASAGVGIYLYDSSSSARLISSGLVVGAVLVLVLIGGGACAAIEHSWSKITYASWLSFTGIVVTALVFLGGYGATQGWFSGLMTEGEVLSWTVLCSTIGLAVVGPQNPLTTWMTANRLLENKVQELEIQLEITGRAFLVLHIGRIEQGWNNAKEVVRSLQGIKPIEPTLHSATVHDLANVRANKRAAA
jgi:hypothetical protein